KEKRSGRSISIRGDHTPLVLRHLSKARTLRGRSTSVRIAHDQTHRDAAARNRTCGDPQGPSRTELFPGFWKSFPGFDALPWEMSYPSRFRAIFNPLVSPGRSLEAVGVEPESQWINRREPKLLLPGGRNRARCLKKTTSRAPGLGLRQTRKPAGQRSA